MTLNEIKDQAFEFLSNYVGEPEVPTQMLAIILENFADGLRDHSKDDYSGVEWTSLKALREAAVTFVEAYDRKAAGR